MPCLFNIDANDVEAKPAGWNNVLGINDGGTQSIFTGHFAEDSHEIITDLWFPDHFKNEGPRGIQGNVGNGRFKGHRGN